MIILYSRPGVTIARVSKCAGSGILKDRITLPPGLGTLEKNQKLGMK